MSTSTDRTLATGLGISGLAVLGLALVAVRADRAYAQSAGCPGGPQVCATDSYCMETDWMTGECTRWATRYYYFDSTGGSGGSGDGEFGVDEPSDDSKTLA